MTEQHTIRVNVDDSEIDLCIEKIERLQELLKEVNPLLKELTSKKKLKLSLTYDLPER